VLSLGACFPDENLRALDASIDHTHDTASDHPVDGNTADSVSHDVMDGALPDAVEDVMDASMDVVSETVADASTDIPKVPRDVGRCERLLTSTTTATTVYGGLMGATYVTLDGTGKMFIASQRDVIRIDEVEARSTTYTSLPGNVTALRVAQGRLVLALVPTTATGMLPMGMPGQGAIYAGVTDGTTAPVQRAVAVRPGDMVVDASGATWFADTGRDRVFRIASRSGSSTVDVIPMITDVTAPVAMAFDASGRTLYVASSALSGSLYSITLVETVLGDFMPSEARLILRDLGTITGIATDVCDNVYIADSTGNRIVRTSAPWGTPFVITQDVANVRSLVFGQGGRFETQRLFFVTTVGVQAVNAGVDGVPLTTR
jgi:sugar lactone lactonase YvrE